MERIFQFTVSIVDLLGPLAQLVEQLTLNQRVRSSSLRRPTKSHIRPATGRDAENHAGETGDII